MMPFAQYADRRALSEVATCYGDEIHAFFVLDASWNVALLTWDYFFAVLVFLRPV